MYEGKELEIMPSNLQVRAGRQFTEKPNFPISARNPCRDDPTRHPDFAWDPDPLRRTNGPTPEGLRAGQQRGLM